MRLALKVIINIHSLPGQLCTVGLERCYTLAPGQCYTVARTRFHTEFRISTTDMKKKRERRMKNQCRIMHEFHFVSIHYVAHVQSCYLPVH